MFLIPFLVDAQGVAIGAGNPTPAASAILDLQSTAQGLLPPRMTTVQRNAIAAPATGLVVYDTTVGALFVRTTAAWVQLGIAGGGSGWSLTGNAGTSGSTNFMGTTDNQSLVLRVNNQRAGYINPLNNNTSFGHQALSPTNQGSGMTAVGKGALAANNLGDGNTALGAEALNLNTDGSGNTAVGSEALTLNTANYNTAVGRAALALNTTGDGNTGIGNSALIQNSTGANNTAIGYVALAGNTVGRSNVAIGAYALSQNTIRSRLVAIGDSALANNGVGVSFSPQALDNTAVGFKALAGNTTGHYNVGVGNYAMVTNTTGWNNSSLGCFAMDDLVGYENTACGSGAIGNATLGNYNCAVGSSALLGMFTGNSNTAVGYQAGPPFASTGMTNTTAIGYNSTVTISNAIVIGTSTNNGLIGGYGNWLNWSDGRYKTGVSENVPGLAFIAKLRPVTYYLDAEKVDRSMGIKQRMDTLPDADQQRWYRDRIREVSTERQTGFIAQEVETAAKEVGFDFAGVHHPVNEQDHYALGYSTFVVPLVKAVQEQQAMIDELRTELAALRLELANGQR